MGRRMAITGCLALVLVSLLAESWAWDRYQSQVGWASWYGAHHHGRKTASGEPFSMYALTAAHRSLPLGTTVRVTSLDTGQQVTVTINDRGPFVDQPRRIIDLSRAAAEHLGLRRQGVGRVRVDVLKGSGPRQNRPATLVGRSVPIPPPRSTGVESAPKEKTPNRSRRAPAEPGKTERLDVEATAERIARLHGPIQTEPVTPSSVPWRDCRVSAASCLAGD
jgi:rare lipoprotein A